MNRRVTVVGPNLGLASGTFSCHLEGCAHLTRDRKLKNAQQETMVVSCRLEVVADMYRDQLRDDPSAKATDSAYFDDFHFAACLKDLPNGFGEVTK